MSQSIVVLFFAVFALSSALSVNPCKECTREFNPVCGFNGMIFKMFDNQCVMENALCQSKESRHYIKVDFAVCGSMSIAPPPPQPNTNEPYHNNHKECPEFCPLNFDPVCGKNGHNYKTFTNLCEMNKASCTNTPFEETRMNFCKIYDSAYNTIMKD